MVPNRHGPRRDFDNYDEYRYLVAISIVVFLYFAVQLARRTLPASDNAKDIWSKYSVVIVESVGDQVMAYLMLSAMSTAISMTNRICEGSDNISTDTTATAIATAFSGFVTHTASAAILGHKPIPNCCHFVVPVI